jgi:Rieske Fe-S protein
VAVAGTGVAQASGTLRVTLSKFPALRKVGGAAVVGSLGGVQVAVVRTARSKYVALDRRCPHAGGTVTQSGNQWVCPLHFSRFDLDGDKVSGATPSGLRKLKSRLSKGVLTITA